MRGEETSDLAERRVLAVDDEGHECHSEGQVLRVEVHDEEADLARGILLSESVCVCEGQGGEERVAVKDDTCKRLSITVSNSSLK